MWADRNSTSKSESLPAKAAFGSAHSATRMEHLISITRATGICLRSRPPGQGRAFQRSFPILLTYKGSAIVIDPKGENAMITAGQRRKLGQAVHVVDPWGITGEPAARFNPLQWLHYCEPEDVAENALMLAESMILRSSEGEGKFWDDEAAALLWGLILYCGDFTQVMMSGPLERVRDIITASPSELKVVLDAMVDSGNLVMESTAARTVAKDEKMRANVFTTLQSHTHFLDSPRMRESLSDSDFRFEDLKTGKETVYLVLPADRLAPFGRWLRLLISQAITVNARNIAAKPDKPILFFAGRNGGARQAAEGRGSIWAYGRFWYAAMGA